MGRRHLPARSTPNTDERPGLGNLWLAWSVLVACVWTAFLPVLGNGFVDWGDKGWILENPSFRGLGWDQFTFAFTTTTGGVYQPLGWLVQSVTYLLFGLDPRGYHLVSLVFHAVNVVLLHALCVTAVARTMPEFAAGRRGALVWLCAIPVGLYAVHPLRVEAVAWASCQAYLPSATLSLLATLAYLRAHPSRDVVRRSWMIGSSLLVVLAVLANGPAVVLPFVFLILDVYPLGRLGPDGPSWRAIRSVLIEKIPILTVCLAFTAVAFEVKPLWIEPEVTTQPTIVGRVAQAGFGAWFYLVKTIWPFGIAAYYPRPEGGDFLTPFFAACVTGLVTAVAAAFRLRRKWPWLPAVLALYLVMASPYLGLERVSITLASDHYGYLPTMAWMVLACAGLCTLAPRRWSDPVRLWAGAGTLVVAWGMMGLCLAQCRVWESTEHLWSHALAQAPWSAELHDFMGTTFAQEGKLDRAIPEFREALRIRPHDFEASSDLGVALERCGDADAAVVHLREARRLQPRNTKVLLNLGAALVRQGHVDEAVALDREALTLEPDFPNLHLNLGVALIHQRKLDAAVHELKWALKLRPGYTEAYDALGAAAVLQNRQDEAANQYRNALRTDPNHTASRINLGLALARRKQTTEAVTELREAIHRDPLNPEAHHVLGAILVTLGRTGEAAGEFEEVLRLRPDHPQARVFLAKARGTDRIR